MTTPPIETSLKLRPIAWVAVRAIALVALAMLVILGALPAALVAAGS